MTDPATPIPTPEGAPPGAAGPARSSYDAVPYSVGAFAQTRPDRLATIATLFGMSPAPPSRCRVLELGCAAGGNLIPMALADPGSEFVGVDLSARQIDDARATARALGAANVDLRAMSILDVGDDFGRFDYVLCHGVYSWVPPDVQDKILRICADHLAPHGVAYVSYNCYPGWHARGAIREMLWYHTERFEDPAVRIRAARGLLAFLARFAPDDTGYGRLIHQELAVLLATPDTYLLHEHLEEFNEPLYFHQFAGRAAARGLQYLAEAQITAMSAAKFGPEGEHILRQISADLLHMEQYMDFLRNRMFRQTLLCRADVRPDYTLRPEVVSHFYVTSAARPVLPAREPASRDDGPDKASDTQPAGGASAAAAGAETAGAEGAEAAESFATPARASLTTSDPLMKAAMHCLAEAESYPIRFDELFAAARARLGDRAAAGPPDAGLRLAARLLNCYLSGLVDFSVSPPPFVRTPGDHPVAAPYARHRAADGGKVVNLRLETVPLSAPARLVLQHLDGGHDRAALVRLVTGWLKLAPAEGDAAARPPGDADPLTAPDVPAVHPGATDAATPEVRASAYVDGLLHAFARSALLVR